MHPRWIVLALVVLSLAGAIGLSGLGCEHREQSAQSGPDTTLGAKWRDWMKGYEAGFNEGVTWAAPCESTIIVVEYVAVSDEETLGCALPPYWLRMRMENKSQEPGCVSR